MSDYDESLVSEWLRDGIAAAKAGRRSEARQLLMRVIDANDQNEQAWLWLSDVVDADEDRVICLENVLTLNPKNVQARAGLRWLQERASRIQSLAEGGKADKKGAEFSPTDESAHVSSTEPAQVPFLTPDGCAYCGLTVGEDDGKCPHCGGRLTTKRFKKEERSPVGYLLHAYWLLLAGINLADFFLLGYVWNNLEDIPSIMRGYLPFFVGSVVAGESTLDTFVETDTWIQIVRFAVLGLAALGLLDAIGLFLRRPRAHALGIVLIALHLLIGLAAFVLGFLGFILASFRALLTVLLTVFMFNTVEDFSLGLVRERLETDRHALNDADYFSTGRSYERRGMWAKALLHWQRAAAVNPGRDTYYAAIARAYARLGRYEDAMRHIEQAQHVSRTPEEWQPLADVIADAQQRSST